MNARVFCCACLKVVFVWLMAAPFAQAASPYLDGCVAEQISWQKHQGESAPSTYRIEKYCRCVKEDVQARGLPSQVDDLDEFPNHKPRWLLTLEGHARHQCEPLLGRPDSH